MDFTLKKYTTLLQALKDKGYRFITFEQYVQDKALADAGKWVILRHDVDARAANALATARIEHALGIQASYYFRVVAQSNKPEIIKEIVLLGHEIGYHYEDMAICDGDAGQAILHFEKLYCILKSNWLISGSFILSGPSACMARRAVDLMAANCGSITTITILRL